MTLELDVQIANLLREVIKEVLFTGRFDESDEDQLMELRDKLYAYLMSHEAIKTS